MKDLKKKGIELVDGLPVFQERSVAINPMVLTEEGLTAPLPDKIPSVIYPSIRAISADKITANLTYYPKEELIGSVEDGTGLSTWVMPYAKPVITNHNLQPGFLSQASEPLGRIVGARILEDAKGSFVNLLAEVSDPDAIQKILSGRYKTVSIGGTAKDVVCSICGCSLMKEGCDHYKGERYKVLDKSTNKVVEALCYYIYKGLKAYEVSYVNAPSDDDATTLIADLGKGGASSWLSDKSVFSTAESYTPSTSDERPLAFFSESFLGNQPMTKTDEQTNVEETKSEETSSNEASETPETTVETEESLDASAVEEQVSTTEDTDKKSSTNDSVDFENLVSSFVEKIEASKSTLESSSSKKVADALALISECESFVQTLKEANDGLVSALEEKETLVKTLQENLNTANSLVDVEKNKRHTLITNVVALEMKRNGYPLSKGKSVEQLIATLKERDENFLVTVYKDMMEGTVDSPVETVQNPTLSESDLESKLKENMDKLNRVLRKNGATEEVDDNGDMTLVPKVSIEVEQETAKIVKTKNGYFLELGNDEDTPEDIKAKTISLSDIS